MRHLIPIAAALALAGCGEVTTERASDAAADMAAFLLAAQMRGATLDGEVWPDEYAAYLGAAAETFGARVPERWDPLLTQVCIGSYVIGTSFDAEAEAVCDALMDEAALADVAALKEDEE